MDGNGWDMLEWEDDNRDKRLGQIIRSCRKEDFKEKVTD